MNKENVPSDNETVQMTGKEYKELKFYEAWYNCYMNCNDKPWPLYQNNKFSTQAFNPKNQYEEPQEVLYDSE